MRIGRGQRSGNVIDRRGAGGSRGGMSLPVGLGAGLGIPGAIIMLVLYLVAGGLGGGGGSGGITLPFNQLPGAAPATGAEPIPPEQDSEAGMVEFVGFVLDDLQIFWREQFAAGGQEYRDAKLVLFRQADNSACGPASAGTGPFYCPADERVYIDLSFFEELSTRFAAPGDFAQAYVIAHEIGHHVQKVTGVSDQVARKESSDPSKANDLSVRTELQADCLAGVWAYSTYKRDLLESGDLDEGLAAAAAVGDDRLQRQAGGRVNPETWTHGSSEQRTRWFRQGFDSGDPGRCDTFSGGY